MKTETGIPFGDTQEDISKRKLSRCRTMTSDTSNRRNHLKTYKNFVKSAPRAADDVYFHRAGFQPKRDRPHLPASLTSPPPLYRPMQGLAQQEGTFQSPPSTSCSVPMCSVLSLEGSPALSALSHLALRLRVTMATLQFYLTTCDMLPGNPPPRPHYILDKTDTCWHKFPTTIPGIHS